MIIKRKFKSAMPSLKRCRNSESAGGGDEDKWSGKSRKKRKSNHVSHGYFPLHLLGKVASGIMTFSQLGFHFTAGVISPFRSDTSEVVIVDSNSKAPKTELMDNSNAINNKSGRPPRPPRPPLPLNSRGHVQELPSRFNDSILDNWKKEQPKLNGNLDLHFDPEFAPPKEKSSLKILKPRDQIQNNKHDGDKGSYKRLEPMPEFVEFEDEKYSGYKRRKPMPEFEKFVDEKYKNFPTKRYSRFSEQHDDVYTILSSEKKDVFRNGFLKEKSEKTTGNVNDQNEFSPGDIVWAKSRKHYPAWPAIVLDPAIHAPQQVLSFRVDDAFCVMFFGYCENGTQRDYAWIRSGMIYSFVENVDRFQGQTDLNDNDPSVLRSAIEEAFLAEHGFTEMLMVEINAAAGNLSYLDSIPRGLHETRGSNQDHGRVAQKQEMPKKRQPQSCEGCGSAISLRTLNKMSDASLNGCLVCSACAKLVKLKHYCGICKKIWNHADTAPWVRCDGCKVWVHTECDKISSLRIKDLEKTDYYCPDCKAKFSFELSGAETCQPKHRCNKKQEEMAKPDKVTVVCAGVEGVYFPSLHMVMCKCGSCGTKKLALSQWERHTGSKMKNWKTSIKVKGSLLPLEKWMLQVAEYHARTVVPVNSLKRPPLKTRKQKLLSFLQENYEPVRAKWTTERCAVCRWIEDWDYNKIIICNRCQIAVHQECYGARNVKNFHSWVCRSCETPDIERECCLCPVKGGALKPTDVDPLWVHVTCAWFRPEVCFASDEKMEPALGILHIPSNSFVKICVICKQIHGSCTQCSKCSTYYHATCASRAGYRMELHSLEKNGKQITRMVSYCAYHRAPNHDTVLVIQTPGGEISAKNLQNNKSGSRLISSKRLQHRESAPISKTSMEIDPFSAARCRVYQKSHDKKTEGIIMHRVSGPCHHSLTTIQRLNGLRETQEPRSFSSFREIAAFRENRK